MFTGLIEEVGAVHTVVPAGDGVELTIETSVVITDIAVDDSISVNGVCLTVTRHTKSSFCVTAVAETLRKTTTGALVAGSHVNLERAVRMADRLGGHLVQGHVDTVGTITEITVNTTGWEVWFAFQPQFRKWLIPVGSICVEGVSLTVANLQDTQFKVAVIPHTLQATTLGERRVGDRVNLEFDMIAKYVENFVKHSASC